MTRLRRRTLGLLAVAFAVGCANRPGGGARATAVEDPASDAARSAGVAAPDPDPEPGARREAEQAGDDALRVAILVEDRVRDAELFAAFEVFGAVTPHAPPGMRVFSIAPTRAPIASARGVTIVPDHDLATAPPCDVLVLPGSEREALGNVEDPATAAFVAERVRSARFVVAFGAGVAALARTGALDGRVVTAAPGAAGPLRGRFPRVEVVDNVRFAVDGEIVTCAGGASSVDAALYLVERLFGSEPARAVASGLALEWDLRATRHLVVDRSPGGGSRRAYRVGERIDPETFVENARGERVRLLDLAGEDDRVIVLILFGGAALSAAPPRAGLWCEDSLFELGTYRHAIARFDGAGAAFVPVACPPVGSEERFGFPPGTFSPGGSPDARRAFSAATLALVTAGLLPFPEAWFDFEFRLLRSPTLGPVGGSEPDFVGRFRADDEHQIFGTPSIWILSRDGRVLAPPFRGNNWEKAATLRHTSRELEAAIARAIEIASSRGE